MIVQIVTTGLTEKAFAVVWLYCLIVSPETTMCNYTQASVLHLLVRSCHLKQLDSRSHSCTVIWKYISLLSSFLPHGWFLDFSFIPQSIFLWNWLHAMINQSSFVPWKLLIERSYVHNILTINHRWLVVKQKKKKKLPIRKLVSP